MGNNFTLRARQWAFTFFFICLVSVTLELSLKSLKEDGRILESQLSHLKDSLTEAENRHSYLSRQINSQNDPSWVEMVLKKELGLTPEGQQKIYFPSPT